MSLLGGCSLAIEPGIERSAMSKAARLGLYCFVAVVTLASMDRVVDDDAKEAGWVDADERAAAAAHGVHDPIDWQLYTLAHQGDAVR
jgi:hypothetical protein